MFVWDRWPLFFRGIARVRYNLAREGLAVSPYWKSASVLLDFGEELGEREPQSFRNADDVVQGNVGLAAFNRTHERTVDSDSVSKALLRIPALRSEPANGLPELLSR